MIESAPATMPSTTATTLVAAFAAGLVARTPLLPGRDQIVYLDVDV